MTIPIDERKAFVRSLPIPKAGRPKKPCKRIEEPIEELMYNWVDIIKLSKSLGITERIAGLLLEYSVDLEKFEKELREERERKLQNQIYVACTKEGCFKIGYSQGDYQNRLRNLQCGCPTKLYMFRLLEGYTLKEEQALHKLLKLWKTDGGDEWYNISPALLTDILDKFEARKKGVEQK